MIAIEFFPLIIPGYKIPADEQSDSSCIHTLLDHQTEIQFADQLAVIFLQVAVYCLDIFILLEFLHQQHVEYRTFKKIDVGTKTANTQCLRGIQKLPDFSRIRVQRTARSEMNNLVDAGSVHHRCEFFQVDMLFSDFDNFRMS